LEALLKANAYCWTGRSIGFSPLRIRPTSLEEALYNVCKTIDIDDARAAALVQLALRELAAKQNSD
jgi:hypothetical protein